MADELNVEVEIELAVLAHALATNPTFVRLVAVAVRDEQTKGLARRNSNIYGLTAQAPQPTQNPRRIS
jgi:hypothetical protein